MCGGRRGRHDVFFFFFFSSCSQAHLYTLASIDCSSWRYPRGKTRSQTLLGEERGKEKILNDNTLKLRLQSVVGPVRTVFDHLLGGSEARGPERCLVPMDPEMGIRCVFFSLLSSRCKTHLSWKGDRNMTFSLWFFVITFLTVCLFAWICHLEIRIACFSVLFQVFVMIRFWYFSSRLWLRLLCVYVCFFL